MLFCCRSIASSENLIIIPVIGVLGRCTILQICYLCFEVSATAVCTVLGLWQPYTFAHDQCWIQLPAVHAC